MRKLSISFTLAAALMIAVTGCLKDEGFENQEYGIQITEIRGVAFPQAPASPIVVGVNSSSTAQAIQGPLLTLEQEGAAARDVHVTLQINQALVTAADPDAIALSPTQFSINSLTVTVPAGQKLTDAIKINLTNTSALDPTKSYGVGLTIASVDEGYKIAANQSNIVFIFNIKNQYDGKYQIKGQFYHPSYPYHRFTTNVEMHTSGPNSVKMFWPLADDYANPWSTGTALTYFDLQDPEFTVNPTTNAVTVQNVSAGAVTFYTMGMGYDNAGYNSRWNPASKTFFACYGYNLGAGGTFVAGTSRMWIDTVIYTGPR